jgi:hypothetical protein
MILRLQILIIVGVIFGLIVFINLVRRERLELRYVLTWFGVLVGIFIVGLFPNIINVVSLVLGIATPINALFFFGFLFVTVLLYSLTFSMSRSANRIKELAQMVALYEYEHKAIKSEGNVVNPELEVKKYKKEQGALN